MSDIATLHDRLNKLVHGNDPVSGKIRDLMHRGTTSVLQAMRSEIAETQLPRRLVFRNDREEEISFEVASGRVLRVSPPTSDHFRADLPEVLTQSLSQSTEAQVLQFITVLKAFASEATKLTVEAQIPRHKTSGLDVGISVEDLLQEPHLPEQNQAEQSSGNALGAFLDDCTSRVSAALLMKGDRFVLEHGPEAQLKALKALALAERASNDSPQQLDDDPSASGQCVIYTGHPQDGQAVLCASQAPNLAFLSFPCEALEAVLGFWADRNR